MPQRTCVACRKQGNRSELVRYVQSPQQQLLVDYRQKLPGRGVYTCCDSNCISKALDRRLFARGLKSSTLEVEGDALFEQLHQALLRRVENLLGMARKSGCVTSGTQAVLMGLKKNEGFAFVLVSEDVSNGIADKVLSACNKKNTSYFRMLTKGRIGEVLGKGERSVAALHAGQLADAIKLEVQRYKQMSREN